MTIKMQPAVKPDNSDRKAEAFISGAVAGRPPVAAVAEPDASKTVVNMRFDVALLRRIDAAARAVGVSRTAWIHITCAKALE
jgi:hypothetical protein